MTDPLDALAEKLHTFYSRATRQLGGYTYTRLPYSALSSMYKVLWRDLALFALTEAMKEISDVTDEENREKIYKRVFEMQEAQP